jgi:hypothetical protein
MKSPETILEELIGQAPALLRSDADRELAEEAARVEQLGQSTRREGIARTTAIDNRRVTLEMARIVSERMGAIDSRLTSGLIDGYDFNNRGLVRLPHLSDVLTAGAQRLETTQQPPSVGEWPFFGWTTVDTPRYGGRSGKSRNHQFFLKEGGDIVRFNDGRSQTLSEDPLSKWGGEPVWLKRFKNPAKVDFSDYWGSHALSYRDYNHSGNEVRMRVALAHLAAIGEAIST